MLYDVTSPESKVALSIDTDTPLRAAVRYVYKAFRDDGKRHKVSVQSGAEVEQFDLAIQPLPTAL